MTIETHIKELEEEIAKQRLTRIRGASAHKRLSAKLYKLEKKLSYFNRLLRRHKAEAREAKIKELINGS